MVKTIGNIKCDIDDYSGQLTMSAKDVLGNDKEYKITPPKFKNEAEKILWTMVNNHV